MEDAVDLEGARRAIDLISTPQVLQVLCVLRQGADPRNVLPAENDCALTEIAVGKLVQVGAVLRGPLSGQADGVDRISITTLGEQLLAVIDAHFGIDQNASLHQPKS
jgi:hypothetical protein